MGENMPDCVAGANNGSIPNPWGGAPYSYDQIYNLAATIVKKQQDQQFNAYQNHVHAYALEQLTKQNNAPPGFGNSVLIPPPPPTLMEVDVPPPPAWSSPTNNQKQFGGIRFNLNQKRLQSSPLTNNGMGNNMLQQQQQQQQSQQQQQQQMNNGNSKKKRKKKNKQNQLQQQPMQNNQHQPNNHHQQQQTGSMSSPNFLDTSIPPPRLSLSPQITPDLSKPPPAVSSNPFSTKPSLQHHMQNLPQTPPPPPPPPMISSNSSPSLNKSASSPVIKKLNPYNNPTDAWPESLNRYVERCYAKCKTDFDKDQIQICLKGRITQAANRGELWTKDWDKESVPSVHSERNNSVIIPKQPNHGVPGQLANFQNKSGGSSSAAKKGISQSLGSRLGGRGSKQRGSRSRSRSRSPYTSSSRKRRSSTSSSDSQQHRSPPRKTTRRSSSSISSDDFKSFVKPTNKKLGSRLGPTNASANAQMSKKKNKNKKEPNKKPFGTLCGDIVSDAERLQQRAARFTDKKMPSPYNMSSNNGKKKKHIPIQSRLYIDDNADNNFDLIDFHIVGTCRDIEKSFLRLTKAPEAHEVRPEEVLVFSLANAKTKWTEKHDYFYACDQLKSIRQDLTVS